MSAIGEYHKINSQLNKKETKLGELLFNLVSITVQSM